MVIEAARLAIEIESAGGALLLDFFDDCANVGGMDIFDIAVAVFMGNLLTASIVWGFLSFSKHNEYAPWIAYCAFLLPIVFALGSLWATGLVPHQFDAIISQ